MSREYHDRFAMEFFPQTYRRVIAEKEVIIHCHHYNARLQNTLESAQQIDGRGILKEAAEAVFCQQLEAVLRDDDSEAERWQLAEELYSHLGYGKLDCSQRAQGSISASASHFVEGWNAHFSGSDGKVCTFTEGYLQGVVYALTGEVVEVREEQCMIEGHEQCRFAIDGHREAPFARLDKQAFAFQPKANEGFLHSPNVDEEAIVDAVVGMPIYGDDEGLIPAFGVYLANTPADFYNLLSIRFIEQMSANGLGSSARQLLIFDAENCGMNTFRGIMHSAEWEGLVAPMIQEPSDNLHGLLAISNALGWGNWHIKQHAPGHSLTLESLNGYEAIGYRELRQEAEHPQCYMLTGVAAGIMALIYGSGTVQERLGTYDSFEEDCICCGQSSCSITAERL